MEGPAVDQYRTLLKRLLTTEQRGTADNLHWRKLDGVTLQLKYGTTDLWSVRASRERRLLLERRAGEYRILGFAKRNDRSVYAGLKEGFYA